MIATGGGGTSGLDEVCTKLDFAAVEATACGIEGTVTCDSREDGRVLRTGTDAAVPAGVTVAVVDSEEAAVFFMGVGGAGGTGWNPAGLEDEAPAVAASTLLLAEAVEAAAGWAGFATETLFAAGTACLATGVFLTAGFDAGFALATGFFTVTGSFDELETHNSMDVSPVDFTGARQRRTQGLYP